MSIAENNAGVKARLALLAKKQCGEEQSATTQTWASIHTAIETLLQHTSATGADIGRVVACIDSLILSRHQFNDACALANAAPPRPN